MNEKEILAATRRAHRANAKYLKSLTDRVISIIADPSEPHLSQRELKDVVRILLAVQDGIDIREWYGSAKSKEGGRPSEDDNNVWIAVHVLVLRKLFPDEKMYLLEWRVAELWGKTKPYVKKLCSKLRQQAERTFKEVGGVTGARRVIEEIFKMNERHRHESIPKPRRVSVTR